MKDKKFDIHDNELRIIGKPAQSQVAKPKKVSKLVLLASALLIITGICFIVNSFRNKTNLPDKEEGVFEVLPQKVNEPELTPDKKEFGSEIDSTATGFTEKIDTVINDIPLSIFIPHNAIAQLCLRTPDINDTSIIFCTQAADIRKDNKKIVGAFVLKGEPLAWGLSKKGFCAIIDNVITVGVANNSPLFEEATEKGGYFFRQYPLVDNGVLVENEPKNKSVRKAICQRGSQTFVVEGQTKESFHDFAQALVDLGVDNAIYLVGGEYAKGWYRNQDNEMIDFSKGRRDRYRNENYIVWKSVSVNI